MTIANQLFDTGRDGFLRGSYNALTGTWVPYIFGSFHSGLLATAVKVSDFGAGVLIARGTYLTGLSATRGEFIAASSIVGAVGSGGAATAVSIVIVNEASQGVPASQLSFVVGFIDTASVLPAVPNGGDFQILWDPSTSPISRVFKL